MAYRLYLTHIYMYVDKCTSSISISFQFLTLIHTAIHATRNVIIIMNQEMDRKLPFCHNHISDIVLNNMMRRPYLLKCVLLVDTISCHQIPYENGWGGSVERNH